MSDDPWIRVRRLAQARDASGLAEMLTEPEYARRHQLRSRIVWRLRELDDPVATRALARAVEADPSKNVRVEAAAHLATRGGSVAEEALIQALEKATDPRIRMHAARGLAMIASEPAWRAVARALDDPARGVRWQALTSLRGIDNAPADVIAALTRALEDPSRRVRLGASAALARVGARSALPAMRRARDRSWPPWRFMISKHIQLLERQLF